MKNKRVQRICLNCGRPISLFQAIWHNNCCSLKCDLAYDTKTTFKEDRSMNEPINNSFTNPDEAEKYNIVATGEGECQNQENDDNDNEEECQNVNIEDVEDSDIEMHDYYNNFQNEDTEDVLKDDAEVGCPNDIDEKF